MAELIEAQEMFFTAFEPKTANRFIMYIDGIPAYLVKAMTRPTLAIDVATLDHINIKRMVTETANDYIKSEVEMTANLVNP